MPARRDQKQVTTNMAAPRFNRLAIDSVRVTIYDREFGGLGAAVQSYFPPISAVCDSARITVGELDKAETVEIPTGLLKELIKIALGAVHVDPTVYAEQNPDLVQAGLRSPEKLAEHYRSTGYFEQRTPPLRFDHQYYLRKNHDVKTAIMSGQVQDAYQHYIFRGLSEGRPPNSDVETEAGRWAVLLARR
jgi:hypothetical protein